MDRFSALDANVIRQVASNMTLGDIIDTCKTSTRFNKEICENQNFWRSLVQKHFPGEVDNIAKARDWPYQNAPSHHGAKFLPTHDIAPVRLGPTAPVGLNPGTLDHQLWSNSNALNFKTVTQGYTINGETVPATSQKFNFTNWKDYFVYLHDKDKQRKIQDRITKATAIFRHAGYRDATPQRQQEIINTLISKGMDSDEIDDALLAAGYMPRSNAGSKISWLPKPL